MADEEVVSILHRAGYSGQVLSGEKSYSGTFIGKLNEVIPTPSTDMFIELSVDVSEIQAIFWISDQDLTVKTNDSATPDNTLSLKANLPYRWAKGDYFANLLTTDISCLYVSNDSGVEAKLRGWMLTDATPPP